MSSFLRKTAIYRERGVSTLYTSKRCSFEAGSSSAAVAGRLHAFHTSSSSLTLGTSLPGAAGEQRLSSFIAERSENRKKSKIDRLKPFQRVLLKNLINVKRSEAVAAKQKHADG